MFKLISPTRIEISKEALKYNYSYLSSLSPKVKIAPVLKSNAYGHGIIHIAKILDPFRPSFFCVNSYYEAIKLHESHIKTPILIMGYCEPLSIIHNDNFSFAVYDKEHLMLFNKYYPLAKLHLFIDTGMHREGILIEKIKDVIRFIKINNIKFEGLMSHFACGDKPNDQITKLQIENFSKAQTMLMKNGIKPRYIHLAASSALLSYHEYPDLGNMARVGLVLYGFDPGGMRSNLKPVLKLITKLVQIKRIKKGEFIGYDGMYKAKHDMTIGILPLGYNDGLDRRLSNFGWVTIENIPCRIVGRISMNITTIDISNIINSFGGQEVIVYSHNLGDLNSIENAAKICKTIPYDLLVRLTSNIRREVI